MDRTYVNDGAALHPVLIVHNADPNTGNAAITLAPSTASFNPGKGNAIG